MANKPSSDLKDLDLSGSSFADFRLRECFLHVPIPFMGALRHRDLNRISNSDEMRPYSIGGWYDRPIPRRIAEEGGIRRESFGHDKFAIMSEMFGNPALLKDNVRQEIEELIKASTVADRLRYRGRLAWFKAQWVVHRFFERTVRFVPPPLRLIYRKIVSRVLLMGGLWHFFEHSHPFNPFAFKWGLSVISKRYELNARDRGV